MPQVPTGGPAIAAPENFTPDTGILKPGAYVSPWNNIADAVAKGTDLAAYANGLPSKFGTYIQQLKTQKSQLALQGADADSAMAAGLPARQAAAAGATADATTTTAPSNATTTVANNTLQQQYDQAAQDANLPNVEAQGKARVAGQAGVQDVQTMLPQYDDQGNITGYKTQVTPAVTTPSGVTLGQPATLSGSTLPALTAQRTMMHDEVVDADSTRPQDQALNLPAGSGSYSIKRNGLNQVQSVTRLGGQRTANNQLVQDRAALNNGVNIYETDPQTHEVLKDDDGNPIRRDPESVAQEWANNKDPNILKGPAFSSLDPKQKVKVLSEADSLKQEPQYANVAKTLGFKNQMSSALQTLDDMNTGKIKNGDPAIPQRTFLDNYIQQTTGKSLAQYNLNSFNDAVAIPDRLGAWTSNFFDSKTGKFDTNAHVIIPEKDMETMVNEENNSLDATHKSWSTTYGDHVDQLKSLGVDPVAHPQEVDNLFKAVHPDQIKGDLSYGSVQPAAQTAKAAAPVASNPAIPDGATYARSSQGGPAIGYVMDGKLYRFPSAQ